MAKLTQEYIDKLYPIKKERVFDPNLGKYKEIDQTSKATLITRSRLTNQLQADMQNMPERVGDGGDALSKLYEMIPLRMRAFGKYESFGSDPTGGFYDENAALRESTKNSIFNLEQVAKAEKLKARKRDKQAFGGGPSTPEKRIPVGVTQGDVGTLLGSSNTSNKTLLGG